MIMKSPNRFRTALVLGALIVTGLLRCRGVSPQVSGDGRWLVVTGAAKDC
jgi:hypothetical protein